MGKLYNHGSPWYVIISGLPGKMAKINAGAICFRANSTLGTILDENSLTGPDMPSVMKIRLQGREWCRHVDFKLIPPEEHANVLKQIRKSENNVIAIDFVKGKGQADRNAQLYFENGIPFVMGSTGVDYDMIDRLSRENGVPCVAFPNMDQRIVAWMYGIQQMAENCPGTFKGAKIKIWESHQADKGNETSGTAKAMINHLGKLAHTELTIDDITMLRDPKFQEAILAVPKSDIGWHAYHNIAITDMDGNSETLTFKRHGGASYVTGTMSALDFLENVIKTGGEAKRYTMFDTFK